MSSTRRMVTLLVLVVLALGALPPPALAQTLVPIDDSVRRVILVPGIEFTFFDTGQTHNVCRRAIDDTFKSIYNFLTNKELRARSPLLKGLPTLPLYSPEHIYAFDYNPAFTPVAGTNDPAKRNEPCVGYDNGKPTSASYTGKPNDNTYKGVDTRGYVRKYVRDPNPTPSPGSIFDPPVAEAPTLDQLGKGAADRFGEQFVAWRAECPECHFDIIAHSLGGAVVSYWVASHDNREDLRHIHSLITIDSPVNGTTKWPDASSVTEFIGGRGLKVYASWQEVSGRVAIDLEDANFGRMSRRAPEQIDMRCISNLYDILIPPQWATIRPENAPSLSYKSLVNQNPIQMPNTPCENFVGRYSAGNPYQGTVTEQLLRAAAISGEAALEVWRDQPGQAHGQPLNDLEIWKLVLEQIARPTPKWQAANTPFAATRVLPAPTLAAPGAQTFLEVQLRNTGAHTWEPGKVVLRRQRDTTLKLAAEYALPRPVRPGEEVTLRLPVTAPAEQITYASDWSLAYGTTTFGPPLRLELIVSTPGGPGLPRPGDLPGLPQPRNPLDDLRAMWEKLVADVRRQAEEFARRMVEEAIRETIRQLCGVVPAIVVVGGGAAAWRLRLRRIRRGKERPDD